MTMAHAGNGSALAAAPPTSVYEALRCVDAPRVHHEVGTIAPDAPLFEAVNRMWWRQVGALPVVHEGRLVGCFAEEDLLRVLNERLRERSPDEPTALVWRELLGDVCVRDAMTPVGKLPTVARRRWRPHTRWRAARPHPRPFTQRGPRPVGDPTSGASQVWPPAPFCPC